MNARCFSSACTSKAGPLSPCSRARRNMLMQQGDITDFPIARKEEDRRFRLIDFGHSLSCLGEDDRGKFPAQRGGEELATQICKITFLIPMQ